MTSRVPNNEPVSYPIFTVRWLAVHTLGVSKHFSFWARSQLCNLFNDRSLQCLSAFLIPTSSLLS